MGTFSKLLPQDSLPKWQVALLASIPVAFGLGYLYYRFNVNTKELIVVNKVSKDKKTVKVTDCLENDEPVEVVSAVILSFFAQINFKHVKLMIFVMSILARIKTC